MQDDIKTNTNNKQYFDIKGPANPDPTSRPVINNPPIQTDPMVSSARQPTTPPDLSSNVLSNGDLDLSLPDIIEDNSVPQSDSQQPVQAIATPVVVATTPAIQPISNPAPLQSNTTDISNTTSVIPTNDQASYKAQITTTPETTPNPTITKTDVEEKRAPAISTSLLKPIEKPKETAPENEKSPTTSQPKIDPSGHVEKHNSHLILKVILGLLILVIAGLTAYLVYKVKFGQ